MIELIQSAAGNLIASPRFRLRTDAITGTIGHDMPLDFARASDLFMGTEKELALALGIPIADVRELRTDPRRVSAEVLRRLGKVLVERGNGMKRVGEMLQED